MEDTEPTLNTTAFLFGNINSKGQLEAEDEDFVCLNKLSDCNLEEINSTIHTLFAQPETFNDNSIINVTEQENNETINSVDYYDESECIEDAEFNAIIDSQKVDKVYDDEDDYDDCVIIENPEEASAKMPPPSELPLNIQNRRNIHDLSNHNSNVVDHSDSSYIFPKNENVPTLNTPLGSILPPEYANVEIQSLFPNYHPDKVPQWGKLFKPFHEPQLYRPLDQWKANPPENFFIDHWNENQEYVYNSYGINMGVMPPNDKINPNDADIFSLPAKSFADCEVSVPFRDIQPLADNINHIQNNHISTKNDNQLLSNHFQKRSKLNDESLLAKRKRRREEKMKKMQENTGSTDKYEILIGLSWRDGPSSYWYDMYNIPLDANIIDYKVKPSLMTAPIDESSPISNIDLELLNHEDSKFSTWQLVHWESDVIIDPQIVKKEIIDSNKKYAPHGGWIPSYKHRNMATFQDAFSGEYFGIWPASSTGTLLPRPDVSQWHSIFALENAQMASLEWINNIIIDPRNLNAQQPYLLELDLNNENIHFDFTNPKQTTEILTSELNGVYLTTSSTAPSSAIENAADQEVNTVQNPNSETPNKDSKQLKKLKILSKISENSELEEKPKEVKVEPVESECFQLIPYSNDSTYQVTVDTVDKNPFYLDYSEIENIELIDLQSPLIVNGIQHSLSAIQLDPFFFPLKLDNQFLRRLHRPRLSDIKLPIAHLFQTPQSICNITDIIKIEAEGRLQISRLTGSGDVFFMRSIMDLSASIDHIILAEYSEEYPPLMMQTGMASRIVNYFPGQPNQPVIIPQLPYGELHVSQQIPFLGQLSSNQLFQALENNMFRAPIYSHKLKNTDFLVIIKSNSLCIRRIDDIFLVGQQLPLMEVPAPNSKKANTFLKDFLQIQIIRMFLLSQNDPKRIRHDEIKNIFSEQSDSALKKRLKMFAEYKKAESGNGTGYWVLKPEFQLPTEDELIECISPEECCAYYSMMWGLLRLEDAGYNSKSLTQAEPDQQDDDEEKESNLKIEDEVKAAPWHTTKTFLDAQKGKCYLELIGVTEPTGCGEGFSYSRVSAKASLFKETLKNKFNKPANTSGTNVPGVGKRMVTGTDADLRKLTLKKAYALLKECGIPEQEIKKLKRWDIIDLVRQMSTQKAKQGEEEGMTKFARSSRLTVADQEERYKSECQRIFNLQNQVLANEDELTSDDGASDDDDDNCDDLHKSIYSALDNRMGINDEEVEMMKIKKSLEKRPDISETNSIVDGGDFSNNKSYTCLASAEAARSILKLKPPVPKANPKALCIRRVIDNGDGTKTNHCQTIPWSYIIKIYFKMNQEHNIEYLRDFCGLNQSREEEKKARKKQQDKIRRLKRQQKQKMQMNLNISLGVESSSNPIKKKYRPKLPNVQLKNKIHTSESLANINCGACGKKGHMRTNKECPLYGKQVKKVFTKRSYHRPNSKPKTIYQVLNPNKLNKSNKIIPTNSQSSIDLNQSRQGLSNEFDLELGPSEVQEEFHESIQDQMMNSIDPPTQSNDEDDSSALKLVIPKQLIAQYSGPSTQLSSDKNKIKNRKLSKDETGNLLKRQQSSASNKRFGSKAASSKLFSNNVLNAAKQNEYILEQKMKGNRRRIDPRVALNHQFEEIYKGLMQVAGYRCFLHPVRKRECPTYYSVIDNPMDLSTVKMRINDNYYETRESFLQDIKLIYDNCITFNGDTSEYSNIAKQLMSYVMEQFCAKERKLMRLERLVNPLMDEDDMVGMRYILEQTVIAMEEVEHARPFHLPVDKKKYPDYMDKISKPMDLLTLRSNIKADRYRSREDFLEDANKILTNCIAYNGENSLLTQVARKMLDVAHQKFEENEATLNSLETNLKVQYEDASDSQMAASSCMTDHLSHIGEDHISIPLEQEDASLDNEPFNQPPSKRGRFSESCEEDKPASISTAASIDANRERIMADLHLTDSEDDDINAVDNQNFSRIEYHNFSESDGGGSQNNHFDKSIDNHEFSNSSDHQELAYNLPSDKFNQYYDENSEHYSESQHSPANVKFYISDDE